MFYRFRLSSPTIAVYQLNESKKSAVIIPAGSEVVSMEPVELRLGFDRAKFVEVQWEARTVQIFLLDLLERGERVNGVSG